LQILAKEVQESDAELAALKLDVYEALQVCAAPIYLLSMCRVWILKF
jgi:hypothetical protein